MNESLFILEKSKFAYIYIYIYKSRNHAWKQIKSELQLLKSTSNYKFANDISDYIFDGRLFHIFGPKDLKDCVHYIFASLFFMFKREHLWNKEKCFLFHLESSFCSWDDQILTFQIFKSHDVTKSPGMKHKTYFTE